MGVFEVGEEMGANLPAVTPAFDMRRGERFAQICGDLLYQLLPYLPVFLVVGFDLRNALGLVFLSWANWKNGILNKSQLLGVSIIYP